MEAIKLLSTAEVSDRLGIPEATLRYWRHRGDAGPRCGRLPGTRRVVYREADVLAWINAAFEPENRTA
jgi:predicted DNA-binding transcriptional regulator AlpA